MRKYILALSLIVGTSLFVKGQVQFSSLSGPNGGGIGDIAINSSGNIFLYAGQSYGGKPTSGSVYRSTNNGTDWTKISIDSNGLSDNDAIDIFIDAADNIYVLGKNNIYISTAASNGNSWTSYTPSAPFEGGDAIIKTDDGDLFIVNNLSGVFRSVDDGQTWSNVSNNLPSPTNYTSIIGIGNDVYVGVLNSGTYKATDPNSNSPVWSPFNAGLSLPDQPSSLILKGTTLYQSNRNGVYYFDGTTWVEIAQDIDSGTPSTYLSENFNSSQHAVVNGDGTRLYLFFSDTGRIYYNDDPGNVPWTVFTDLQIGDNVYALGSFITSVFVGYGRHGLIRSTNAGVNWSFSDSGITLNGNSSFIMTNSGRFLVANGTSALNVSDYGYTWTKEFIDNACKTCWANNLYKKSNGDILAIGNDTYLSLAADNGTNWTDIGGPGTYLQQVVSSDETTFYGYQNNYPTDADFYISTDGAVSFLPMAITGLPPADYDVRGIAVDASNNLFIALHNSLTFNGELYKVDNGSTVATLVTNTGLTNGIDNIQNAENTIYVMGTASGNRKIAKTTDGGSNWTSVNVTVDIFDFLVISPDVFIGMGSFGNSRYYYYSNNAGVDWEEGAVFTSIQDTRFVGGMIDANGRAYVSLTNAPVYESQQSILRPIAPTNLQVIANGENAVILEWDHDFENLSDFIIQRKLQGTGTFVSLDSSIQVPYYTDNTLVKNTTYVYRVIAYNSNAGSNISSELVVSTKNDCVVAVADIPDNRSWTGSVDGGAFISNNIAIKKINGDVYGISDITAGSLDAVAKNSGGTYGSDSVSSYFYRNCGEPFSLESNYIYPNGNGTWDGTTLTLNFQIDKSQYASTEKTITLTLNATDPDPSVPEKLTGYVYDNTSIKLQWESGYYQSGFIIHRSETPDFVPVAGTVIAEVDYPTTTYVDAGPLTFGNTYYYKVIAKGNGAPDSAPSAPDTVLFTKPYFVPSPTTVWNVTGGAATAAWADFNNDGLEDLIMPLLEPNNNLAGPLLFQNTGTDFQLLTGKFPLGIPYVSPSVGDFDNDGLIDVYMTSLQVNGGSVPSKYSLFKNTGDFNFVEQNIPAISQVDDEGSFSSSWVDYNNDGNLDLFVANQTKGGQTLFQGNGAGSFTKITTGELATDQFTNGYASWSDFDQNGFQDVLIVSIEDTDTDGDGNGDILDAFRLFTNNSGTFTKVTGSVLDADDNKHPWTYSWGDYDNDLDMDLFAGNQSGAGLLYKNNADGTLTKVNVNAGTPSETPSLSPFSSAWGDVDNDGDLDLLVTRAVFDDEGNGIVNGNDLYLNQGDETFVKLSGELLTSVPGFYLSGSFADYDQDGFLDVVLGQIMFQENGPTLAQPNVFLLKNNNSNGNWTEIKLEGITSNKSAIGARIVVTTGTKSQMREITSHTGFGSQSSLVAHFGLGTATVIDNIQITWPSGIVQNITNQPVNTVLPISEDGTGPALASAGLSPAHNDTDINTNTTLAITLNEASTPVAGKMLLFYLNDDFVTPVGSIEVTEATVSGNTYTFSPPEKLLTSTVYHIGIEPGAFLDVYGNPSLVFPSGEWTFTTAAGPQLSTLSPANNATAVVTDAALSITFNENVVAAATKTIKVMNGTTAVVDLDVSSNGTITNNTYTLPAPTGGWPFNTTLEVIVDAGAFTDADDNDFAGIAAGSWTFTTVDAPDVTAPGITFTPLSATLEKGFTTIAIEATVVDDKNVASVNFQHRKISEQNFTPLSMTFNNGTSKWEAQVPNSFVDDMGFEYFIEAYDGANTGRLPLDNTTYFKSTITFTGANAPMLALPSGGTKNSWKIISVPHALPTSQIETIFSSLGTYDKTKWRLINYTETPSQDWVEYPTFLNIERGKGYFINTKDGGSITFTGATAPANTRDNLFTMNLAKGWNLVGNPYSVAVNWEDVRAYNPTKNIGGVKIFNSGTYSNGNELLVFQGGFVFMDDAATDIKVPFKGQTTPGGGRKGFNDLGTDIAAEEWALPVTLIQNDLKYELGAVGMAKDASVSYDNYDDVTPPRFFDYLEMNFSHPEHFAKRFTRDIVPTQNNYTWDFTVDTNIQGYAELNWNNIPIISSSKDLFLLDISANRLINMKETGSYLFDPKVSANFKVYFGENLKIAPEQVHLGNAYPNPTSGYTTIAFSLPETGGTDQLVTLDIMDAMGRAVGKISEGRYNPGFHETGFDAKQLNNGFYTYRLTVQGKQGSSTQVNKLIIK